MTSSNHDHDELEPTLRSALDRHAATGGQRHTGTLDDVWNRVDQRRARRRSVAVFGSLAVVAAGVVGIAALARGGASDPMAAGATDSFASTTLAATNAWACSGYLTGDGVSDYYEHCVPVSYPPITDPTSPDNVVCVSVAPTTAPPVPSTTATPAATVLPSIPDVTLPVTTVAETAVPSFVEDCWPPATAPATTYVVEGTFPTPTTAAVTSPPLVSGNTFFGEQAYSVVPGDSLASIAAQYDITLEVLVNYNSWPEGLDHVIVPGDVVKIPPGSRVP